MQPSKTPQTKLWIIMLLVIFVTGACATRTVVPTQPQVESQSADNPSPDLTNTPESSTETNEPKPTLPSSAADPVSGGSVVGYVDSSPAVFLKPVPGLKVEISEGRYSSNTGALESFKVIVSDPTGIVGEWLFNEIDFNTNTGNVDGYNVTTNGKDEPGPSVEGFEKQKSELGSVLAFSLPSTLMNEPLPVVSVPCGGDSTVEYDYQEQYRQVKTHEIKCSEKTYKLNYSDYVYDNQLGGLAGYTVTVEVSP